MVGTIIRYLKLKKENAQNPNLEGITLLFDWFSPNGDDISEKYGLKHNEIITINKIYKLKPYGEHIRDAMDIKLKNGEILIDFDYTTLRPFGQNRIKSKEFLNYVGRKYDF